jgi:hypothetical protein
MVELAAGWLIAATDATDATHHGQYQLGYGLAAFGGGHLQER